MLLFVSASIIAVLFAFRLKQTGNYNWLIASLSIIFIILAFQDNIGQDFSGYVQYFDEITRGVIRPAGFAESREPGQTVEMGWWFINKMVGYFIPSYYAVTVVVYSIICYSLYCLLKRIPNDYVWLSVFYFYFSTMLFFMSVARQSLAIALFVLTILNCYDKKYLRAILIFLIGCTIHNTMFFSALFVPLLYFDKIESRFGMKTVLLTFVFMFIGAFLYGNTFQNEILSSFLGSLDEADFYAGRVLDEDDVSSFTLKNILSRSFIFAFALFAYCRTKGLSKFFGLLFLISQIMDILIGQKGELGRLSYYGIIFGTPLIGVIPSLLRNHIYKIFFIMGLVFIVLWQFYSSVSTNYQYERFLEYKTIFF